MKPREALNLAQLQLLLQLPELAAQPGENPPVPIVAERRPPVAGRKNRAPRLPEHLPLVEESSIPNRSKPSRKLALHRAGSQ